jgi:uncharacterized protein with PIN domain
MMTLCKRCGNKNSWVKNDKYTIRTESDKVIEQGWECNKCGEVTWRPPETLPVSSSK